MYEEHFNFVDGLFALPNEQDADYYMFCDFPVYYPLFILNNNIFLVKTTNLNQKDNEYYFHWLCHYNQEFDLNWKHMYLWTKCCSSRYVHPLATSRIIPSKLGTLREARVSLREGREARR